MTSLRIRLAVWLVTGFLVLVAAAGLWIFEVVKANATHEFDDFLTGQVTQLSGRVELEKSGRVEFDYEARFHPEFEREQLPNCFQIWFADGRVLYRSSQLEGDLLPPDAALATTEPHDFVLQNGRKMRVASRLFEVERQLGKKAMAAAGIDSGPTRYSLVLAVARGRERLDAAMAEILRTVLLIGLGAAVVGALFVWLTVRRGLSPVQAMARQVAGLTPDDLTQRVHLPRTPAELRPIVQQINGLVDRLETAMQRERRFAGNVAHELRTPVTELRTLAQVAGRWHDDEEAVRRFFGDVDDVARRMQVVIGNMLLLARCANGSEPTAVRALSPGPLLAASWQRQAAQIEHRDLNFEQMVADDVVVESDPDKLGMIFDNLIGNAVSYATIGSRVRARAEHDCGRVTICIENHAESLTQAEMRRLSEPFWRRDEARSAPQHAGLGLSVVCALADRLGATVIFDQDRDGLFRVSLAGFVVGRVSDEPRRPTATKPRPQPLQTGERT